MVHSRCRPEQFFNEVISLTIAAITWLVFLVVICFVWYQDDGILFFLDFNRVGMIIWCLGTGLYDLALSDLYHPNILINVVSIITVGVFWLFEVTSRKDLPLLKACFSEIKIPNNIFYWIMLGTLSCLAFYAFKTNADAGMLRGLSNNPGMKVDFEGGYLYRLSVPVAICFYIVARCTKGKCLKLCFFVLFCAFVYFTACDLSRGPIVWILTGCLLFELLRYVNSTGQAKLSGKTLLLLTGVFVVVVFAFDSFGSMRTVSLFSSVSSQYQMKVNIPDGFTWLYIYISSPLENARYALENIAVLTPTLGGHLFYPFIKFASNLFGLDSSFTVWLSSNQSVYSYMAIDPGLTVGSFVMDAYQDFSILGIVIYPLFYGLVSLLVKDMLSWQRLSTLTKLVVYSLAIQGPLWSIFDDTVFSGPLWVCAFAMIAIDLLTSFLTIKARGGAAEKAGANGLYLEGRR